MFEGDRVYHKAWGCYGTVTRMDGSFAYVQWDNCCVEDQCHYSSLTRCDVPVPQDNRTGLVLTRG